MSKTYMDLLEELLATVPMVTKEQAVLYMCLQSECASEKQMMRVINTADKYKRIWQEHLEYIDAENEIQQITFVSADKVIASSKIAKKFPYAFWLYLANDLFDSLCRTAEEPFIASFVRHQPTGGDTTAQVAVYDFNQDGSLMQFAMSVSKYTKDIYSEWFEPSGIPPGEIKLFFWRAIVLVHAPDSFWESEEFELLRGLGFSLYFSADGYMEPPKLQKKEDDPEKTWERVMSIIKR